MSILLSVILTILCASTASLSLPSTNISVYHINPKSAGEIPINMDTGDALGDLYFYVQQFFLPEECKDDPRSFDCQNPERLDKDLVVTKVDLNVKPNSDTTYSACNLCNGTDPFTGRECVVGSYVCDCFGEKSTCDPSKVGVENITTQFVPQGPQSQCYQDLETKCGTVKNGGRKCEQCAEYAIYRDKNGCSFTDVRDFCTTDPCSETSPNWLCWRGNAPRKFPGLWYSTLKEGMCANHQEPAKSDNLQEITENVNCSWTVLSTRTVNESCMRDRIASKVEQTLPQCFETCPNYPSRNMSSTCWISCFFEGIFGPGGNSSTHNQLTGIAADDIVKVWDNAFLPESEGGCDMVHIAPQ
jgi:hypothetical protein